MKSKHLVIPLVGAAIIIALWLLFRTQPVPAATDQPNTQQSTGLPSGSTGTAVTPSIAPIPTVPAMQPGLPPQLTFNLGPQGNAGQTVNNQMITGLSGNAGSPSGIPNVYPGSGGTGMPATGSCGGCGTCQDCNQTSACTTNRSNFDGAGACLAPNPKQQLRSIAGSEPGNAPTNPFNQLLNNLFLSGEGPNLSMNALQMIQFGLTDAQGNGGEGFTAPANPQYQGYGASMHYNTQPVVPNIPGYTMPFMPLTPSQVS